MNNSRFKNWDKVKKNYLVSSKNKDLNSFHVSKTTEDVGSKIKSSLGLKNNSDVVKFFITLTISKSLEIIPKSENASGSWNFQPQQVMSQELIAILGLVVNDSDFQSPAYNKLGLDLSHTGALYLRENYDDLESFGLDEIKELSI